jgi:acetate kinase
VTNAILALNAGSSSLKFGLFDCSPGEQLAARARGTIRRTNEIGAKATFTGTDGTALVDEQWPGGSAGSFVERLLGWIEALLGNEQLAAVGHRIVHGGPDFSDPIIIDEAVLEILSALTPLAPLHQPSCLEPVRILARMRPNVPQIACFDTAFHRTMAPPASRYALPRAYEAEGVRHYGFHGLSYQSIAAQLAEEHGGDGPDVSARIVVAHLGNGASLCAMQNLMSVDTTMGFSTLDGLVMGTRAGSLDPGILLYLLKEKGFSPDTLEDLLYRQSGLLGVSRISEDVAALLASPVPAAADALGLFAFSITRHTAALAASLGGLDHFIFTGGIGENAAAIREMVVRRLEWLGAELDDTANGAGARRISTDRSLVLIERRSTNEELAIAREVYALLDG